MASSEEQFDVNDNEEDQAVKENIRITITITPDLRQRIKIAALNKNLSISEYLSNILEQSIPDEITVAEQARHPVPSDVLDEVYRIREQVLRESKGRVFEDSTETIRRMREERNRELDAAVPHEISYNKEGKPLTREKLEHVLKVREEIIARTNGRTFDDSTELIRQMRDERTRELDEL